MIVIKSDFSPRHYEAAAVAAAIYPLAIRSN